MGHHPPQTKHGALLCSTCATGHRWSYPSQNTGTAACMLAGADPCQAAYTVSTAAYTKSRYEPQETMMTAPLHLQICAHCTSTQQTQHTVRGHQLTAFVPKMHHMQRSVPHAATQETNPHTRTGCQTDKTARQAMRLCWHRHNVWWQTEGPTSCITPTYTTTAIVSAS